MKPLLFVTDTWSSLDHPRDTSLRLIEEFWKAGQSVYWCEPSDILYLNDHCFVQAAQVVFVKQTRSIADFQMSSKKKIPVTKFNTIFYRVDPPVDEYYLSHYGLLYLGGGKLQPPPKAAWIGYEKLNFDSALLVPRSCATSSPKLLKKYFAGTSSKKTVSKPLNGAQSKGVILYESGMPQHSNSSRPSVHLYQEFLPSGENGETRLWFAAGKLVSWAKKKPPAGEWKFNLDNGQGSKVIATKLTLKQKQAATQISRRLRRDQILLAAVDLIGSKIIDFNVTSPGLLVEIEGLGFKNLSRKIVQILIKNASK